jgi:hypothetical protein
MQTRQGNILQALRGVQAFLDAHPELATVASSGARKKLDAQVDELNIHVQMQSGSILAAKGDTQKQYALRQILLTEFMAPIARIARAELPQTPELEPLRMPRGRVSTERLHAAALGMAKAAEPHTQVFIDAGLSTDFANELRAAASAMLLSIDARTQNRGARSGATRGIDDVARSALKTVGVLDAFVRRALRGDAALLASWKAVKTPPPKTGKSGADTPDAPPTPPAAPGGAVPLLPAA